MNYKRYKCVVVTLVGFFMIYALNVLYFNGFAMVTQDWRSLLKHKLQFEGSANTKPTGERRNVVPSQVEIVAKRREVINNACDRIHRVSNRTFTVTGNKAANFSYCVIPKAGCTLWLRILKYIHGQKRDSHSPMSISKYEVHYQGTQFSKQFSVTGASNNWTFIRNSFRAMTVRNPYTRLWSAFIDKLLLPDFWQTKGRQIIRFTRHIPHNKSVDCGSDVTFSEFIEYVIHIGHSFDFWGQDRHWLPASDLCDPCLFHPVVLAKQETFMTDVEYVLQNVGLSEMIHKVKAVDPVEYEIKDEIDYNFRILPMHSKCVDKYTLCKRMWTAFVLNGYIPAAAIFPAKIDGELTPGSFYDIIHAEMSRYKVTRADTKRWRSLVLTAAYSHISERHMEQLEELYKNDFELFGYDSKPHFV